jgi:hypothetical protein
MSDNEHDRNAYILGCRCATCTAANKEYQIAYRRRSRMKRKVTAGVEDSGPGRVEAAVQLEVDQLGVAEQRPGLVAAALAMARILDTEGAVTSQPAACRQLMVALAELHRVPVSRRGRLAVVQKLSTKGGA